MKVDPKSNLLICNVCGHAWEDHGLGGNCTVPANQKEEKKKHV